MAWGNPTPMTLMRKRHIVELARRDARIRELESQVARLIAAAPHPSACAYWRGGQCDCGVAA